MFRKSIILFVILAFILFVVGLVLYFYTLMNELVPHGINYKLRDAALYTTCIMTISGFLGLYLGIQLYSRSRRDKE